MYSYSKKLYGKNFQISIVNLVGVDAYRCAFKTLQD